MHRGTLRSNRQNRSTLHLFRTVVAVLTAVAGLAVAQLPAESRVPGQWITIGPLVQPRFHHTATLLRTGEVLVAGGQVGNTLTNTAELISPLTLTSRLTGSMRDPRWRHTATLLQDGRVLVAGGFGLPLGVGANAQPVLDTAEIYDPATGTWSPTGSMSTRRALHAAQLLPDGKVLVAGGRTCNVPPPTACNFTFRTATAELFDPATGTWTPTGSMNEDRHTTAAALLPGGEVLVPGGFTTIGNPSGTADRYDPDTGTWVAADDLVEARARQGAVVLPDGRVLVTAGFPNRATSEVYDPVADQWELAGSPVFRNRFNFYTALMASGRVIVAGGAGGGVPPNSVEFFDPATGLWTRGPDMPNPHGSSSSLGNTDRAIVLSGSPDAFVFNRAVCGNYCGAVLIIGNNAAGTIDMYVPASDFGDAPDTYRTTLASDGPSHQLETDLVLGASVDAEGDGLPSAAATGDDANGTDDEDGVTFAGVGPGATATATVTASLPGRLDAWVDFNGDGAFQPAERITQAGGTPVAAGPNPVSFAVPLGATSPRLFARFRLSTAGGLAPTGGAFDGEVEDHLIASQPTGACPAPPPPPPGAIVGTAGDDVLTGTPGPDIIYGLGGQDRIDGLGGNDVIFAGDGNDQVGGGPGMDRLLGGAGEDAISGDDGNDRVEGEAGNDLLEGGAGNDELLGGLGDDSLSGGPGNDRLDGGPGTNTLQGGPGGGFDACVNPPAALSPCPA